jgi:3-oxoacyl-(acyl-carrier-protein) synthase
VAAGQTLRDAGIARGSALLPDCGIYAGSLGLDQDFNLFLNGLRASMQDGVFDPALFADRGMAMIDPLFLVRSLPNSGLCGISIEFGILGQNLNVMNGPVSALQAIGAAAAAIRNGNVSRALAGGYDSLFQLEVAVGHAVAGHMALPLPSGVQPASGFVPGEGAGFLLLERDDAALARGARIYGEIVSDSQACRDSDSLRSTAASAIDRAGMREVDIVFGDVLGIPELDKTEADAMRELSASQSIRFCATAPHAGSCGVAGAAFSAIHALLAISGYGVPPAALGYSGTGKRKPGSTLAWCTDRGKSAAVAIRRYGEAN